MYFSYKVSKYLAFVYGKIALRGFAASQTRFFVGAKMEEENNYFYLELESRDLEKIIVQGRDLFDGIEEFNISEEEIDKSLGKEAFVGAELNLELADRLAKSRERNYCKFYFYGDLAKHRLASFVELIKNFNIENTIIHEIENKDWNEEWRKSYRSIKINNNYSIVPSWEKKNHKEHSKNIYIYPGMGFGTGTHPTTFYCLKLFFDRIEKKNNLKVLDFGCGSGILGIGAILLNDSALVDFCDVDTQALDNCVQNIHLNFEGENLSNISVISREKYVEKEYELVFANILQNILFDEIELISKSVIKSGNVILSGITVDQVEETMGRYEEKGFQLIALEKGKEWAAILLEKI